MLRGIYLFKLFLKSAFVLCILYFVFQIPIERSKGSSLSLISKLQILGTRQLRKDIQIHQSSHPPEERVKRQFWKSLVKRYWDLKTNQDLRNEDEMISFTDMFLSDHTFSLWGTHSRQDGTLGLNSSFVDMDRIIPQLVMTLEGHNHNLFRNATPKRILLVDSFRWWHYDGDFSKDCPGWALLCEFIESGSKEFDGVVVARDSYHQSGPKIKDSVKQFFFILESPFASSASLQRSNDLLATYWKESDVVAPYGKWAYYNPETTSKPQSKNYVKGKTKLVAAFISNCAARNGRLQFVEKLQKYIQVDVFGACGKESCTRSQGTECFKMLQQKYKFYLSFENSNCEDYITEKFFNNALENDVVPIVLGAKPSDYVQAAPQNSYIHIEDFSSAEALAEHLKSLDKDDSEYMKYFSWKGTGEFIRGNLLCRVCAMLHYSDFVPPPQKQQDFQWSSTNKRLCLDPGRTRWSEDESVKGHIID